MFYIAKTLISEMPHRLFGQAVNKLHGATSQKAAIFIVTVVKNQTSDFTFLPHSRFGKGSNKKKL
jgi:hypothetical protein